MKIIDATKESAVDRIVVMSPSDLLPLIKKMVFNIKNANGKNMTLDKKVISWKSFMGKNDGGFEVAIYEKRTCCMIVHTGGATGITKGVMLSNENVNAINYTKREKLMG